MNINVTITGADDDVSSLDLHLLSLEFPFVEWGILRCLEFNGQPRYPSMDWVNAFLNRRPKIGGQARKSLHLCKKLARDAEEGRFPSDIWRFDRVQLNGYNPGHWDPRMTAAASGPVGEIILQCRSEETLQQVANDAARLGPHASVLFDPSGGRGVEPFRWPASPCGCRLGFAGGINPDNVLDVIGDIVMLPRGPFWIDMETGVRTDNRFDLRKVRRVLEQVATVNARMKERD